MRTHTSRAATKAATLLAFAAVGIALTATTARAGSDSPTPYIVDTSGVTLPAGDTFPAHGHLNARTTDGQTFGLHLDPNNSHPGTAWIGTTSIPWTALGIPTTACVSWVQISTYNEHYGEGGQPPVCLTRPTQEPTWTPAPTPGPTPTTSPTAAPSPTSSPTSSEPTAPPTKPSPTPEPSPTEGPTSTPSPSPDPTPTTTPSSEPTPTPSEPSPTVSRPSIPTPSSTSTSDPAPTPAAVTSPSDPATTPTPPEPGAPTTGPTTSPTELAATGIDGSAAFLITLLVALVGVIAVGVSRKGGAR